MSREEMAARIAVLEAECKALRKLRRTAREPIAGIGGEIQRQRESKGMKLTALAHASGISKGNISRIETDPSMSCGLNTLFAIAKGLNIPAWVLVQHVEQDATAP